jgi:sulfur carrier protein
MRATGSRRPLRKAARGSPSLRGKIDSSYKRSSAVLSIVVNGSSRDCTDRVTVADLIRELALEGKRVAVERNGEIVPKSRHADTLLANGDRIEVVRAVGGG